MALVLNEEQQMLKESAQGFFAEYAPVSELRAQRDAGSEKGYADKLWPQMVDMGWAAILIPEEYGGLSFGHVGMAQISEQAGRTLTASPLFSTAILGVTAIVLAGNEEQKADLLGAIAEGSLTLALAIDEKSFHAPLDIEMSAERMGANYQLNGIKRAVVDGGTADKFVVAVRTSGKAGDRHGYNSVFWLTAARRGFALSEHPWWMVEILPSCRFPMCRWLSQKYLENWTKDSDVCLRRWMQVISSLAQSCSVSPKRALTARCNI